LMSNVQFQQPVAVIRAFVNPGHNTSLRWVILYCVVIMLFYTYLKVAVNESMSAWFDTLIQR
jgi:hypothetical protein